ncbi:MAG: EamA family transporter [Hyphomicrobiales bacterium]|nr:EamA family transporter [Hyphomicrobiales bacterium]MCY4054024.1 EamA family transporter [Hyphomicrobiales bacterium]
MLDQLIIICGATLVAFLWGSNFIVINELIVYVGPLNIVAFQFLACWPFLLFVTRPNNLRLVIWWGLTTGALQYGFQNLGLAQGISPGIASVLLQLQAFFTPMFLSLFFKERLSPFSLIALGAGLVGVFILSSAKGSGEETYVSAVVLLVLASISWALGNLAIEKMQRDDVNRSMFSVIVYAGAILSIPMTLWAGLEDGPITGRLAVLPSDQYGYLAFLFSFVLIAFFGGYQIWNLLIKHYGGGRIVRYSLLVPVFGLTVSQIVYGGHLSLGQGMGISLILLSLVLYRLLEARGI